MKNNNIETAVKNNPTVSVFLRCPEPVHNWLKEYAEKQGFRSIQECILQILREHKDLNTADNLKLAA